MALGTPTLATPLVGGSTTNISTASFAVTPGVLYHVAAGARAIGPVTEPAISDNSGGVMPWQSRRSEYYNGGAGTGSRLRVWSAIAPANAPANLEVTITAAGGRNSCAVVAITGAVSAPLDAKYAGNNAASGGDVTVTLGAAPAANSTVLSFYSGNGAAALTEPAGFIQLAEDEVSTSLMLGVAYDVASASTSQAWTSSNSQCCAISVEILTPGSGRVSIPWAGR